MDKKVTGFTSDDYVIQIQMVVELSRRFILILMIIPFPGNKVCMLMSTLRICTV